MGANIEAQDSNGDRTLSAAADKDHLDVVEKGSNIDAGDNAGDTALTLATTRWRIGGDEAPPAERR